MSAEADTHARAPLHQTVPAVLAFHKLSPRLSFGSTNYSPRRFRQLLNQLTAEGYSLAPLAEVLAGNAQNKVAVSFDDGYAHLMRYLPSLIGTFELRPTVFMPTACIAKSNSWDYSHLLRREPHLDKAGIRELARLGVTFGCHGHSHVDLSGLRPDQVRDELRISRDILEQIIDRRVTVISYPFGRVNDHVVRLASEAGFTDGFTMSFPEPGDQRLARGRYPVYFYDTPRSVARKLKRGRLYGYERFKAAVSHRLSAGTILLNRLKGGQG